MADSLALAPNPLATLLELGHRARLAETVAELEFILANDTHGLAPYRQAAVWLEEGGVCCLSGIVQIEANAPYVQWLEEVCRQLEGAGRSGPVTGGDIEGAAGDAWAQWLPANGLWLPMPRCPGALFLAREVPWTEREISALREWVDLWSHAWRALRTPSFWSWPSLKEKCFGTGKPRAARRWWQRAWLRWTAALLVLCIPVRLTVMAPGELVPVRPAVIRAPLEGVIDAFHVQPNERVEKGQPLFGFDEARIRSQLQVSRQALATAETEYRQTAQQALSDARYKAQLAVLAGKIGERRAEAAFVADQLDRARVLAPQGGIALFDDPSEWIGRPVSIGERVMRIATPDDVEVEAWVPLADAIPLAEKGKVSLYLSASPLTPVVARLRYMAHDASERPDGTYAYRLRASLDSPTTHRVGLRGTAKLEGGWAPLAYWVLRRPLASIRATLGV
ncbi:HlyD family efflux transporter periplasmic adaptor subunit [Breoghania sp.]|uniref:efflux RND transporter periplasmic adaptor subunit n=1 Tax=Breoghania sp. TaxID=2065378 RepID=UPI002AAC1CB4|nr:HlyD family efflux transporter periplasmic adaptor subunit [Breoghania sp.]